MAPIAKALTLSKSQALLERAKQCIPVQAQTFSKAPYYFVQGVYPVYVEQGKGSRIWDADGNQFIDYILGLGPLVLGYCHPVIDAAIMSQLKKGITFSLSHTLEVELSELLCEVIPCAEMVRFLKTGSDACSAAVRVARAYTGREKIAYCGYHGWHDWYAVTTDLKQGIPPAFAEYMHPFIYNDIDSLKAVFEAHPGEIAAVSLEPIMLDPPEENFLDQVKDLAHKNGALLIFDEIITGFRYAVGGAQERYGVTPDLAVIGKAMGNGMPISAVVGKREIMSILERIFVSTTFGGEALSLAASIATIRYMQENPVIDQLWQRGSALQSGFNALANRLGVDAVCTGESPRMKIEVRDKTGVDSAVVKSLFMQETVRRGILFHPGIVYPMAVHSEEDIDKTLQACEAGLQLVGEALASGTVEKQLQGQPASAVFARIPGTKKSQS
jgi:glutamate-1-semialdehyde aminotransferase